MSLPPCPYRHVDDEGHILCNKIKTGDREVSPNICHACPVAAINCAHLRATLDRPSRPPLIVRYGNGKQEVWDYAAPIIALARAACAVKVAPIHSPRDCAGCPLRQALITPDAISVSLTPSPLTAVPVSKPATRPAPIAHPSAPMAIQPATPSMASAPSMAPTSKMAPAPVDTKAEERRAGIVAEKIIKLQEWLEKQKAAPGRANDDAVEMPLPRAASGGATSQLPGPRAPRPQAEEKRVGWTD